MPTATNTHNATPGTAHVAAAPAATDIRLVVHRAMTSNRDATLGPPPLSPTVGRALDAAATGLRGGRVADCLPPRPAPRPRRAPGLPGVITITPNRTAQPRQVTTDAPPTRTQLASLLAAENLTHDLLATGFPADLATRADVIAGTIGGIGTAWRARGLDRRGITGAEAAAVHHLNHVRPADRAMRFVTTNKLRAVLIDNLDDLRGSAGLDEDEQRLADAAARLHERPRVIWADLSRVAAPAMLVDRFHHTHLLGTIERDTWTLRKVAEDLASAAAHLTLTARAHGRELSPEQLLAGVRGVRVSAHLAPNAGRHFTAQLAENRIVVGPNHSLGACAACATTTHLPTSSNPASPSRVDAVGQGAAR